MGIDITIVADQEAFFADAATPTHPTHRWIQAKETSIIRDVTRTLAARLPTGWSADISLDARIAATALGPDAIVKVQSPDGQSAEIVIEVKRRIEPRMMQSVVERVRRFCTALGSAAVPVVSATYLSPRTRDALAKLGVGYIDMTGNIRLEISSPGLFISAAGAHRDPWPAQHALSSLRGRGAAVALRVLVDNSPPYGVRQLAESTAASAPTLSRVIELLDREGIITREPRGRVLDVDWQAAIHRWAEDYGQLTSNQPSILLDPRGLRSTERRLASASFKYATTGAFAAQRFNPIAGARTATLYVEDPYEAAHELGLREVDSGANVVLLEPLDPIVFEGATTRDGLRCVGPSQLSVDLLTGPGREPSQGEALLDWMRTNEHTWRT